MKRLLLPCLALLLSTSATPAQESWPRFRGANGDGHGSTAIPEDWEANTLWKVALPGTGHGSPVIVGGKIFLLAGDETSGERVPLCLDAATGELLWKDSVSPGNNKKHKFNSVASTTPAATEEAVFFTWGTKEQLTVAAYDHDGKALWTHDHGAVQGGHGFGASPVVHGDLVVLNNDQDKGKGSLFALDQKTGDLAWEHKRTGQRLSYSCPVAFTAGDRDLLAFVNWQHGFTALDPTDGSLVDELSVFDTTTNERAISSPITAGDLVIGTCGFTNNPKHCVAMRLEGDKWEEVWRVEKSVAHIPCLLAADDLVFMWGDGGIVTCLERESGEEVWRERVEDAATFYSSPVLAGDLLWNIDEAGHVFALRAGREFEVVARNDIDELARATPALAGGVLYLRTFEHLRAIGKK